MTAAAALEIEGLESLGAKLDYLAVAISDLRPLFEQFSADFYKDQKRLFQLKGPGQFADLSPAYAETKQKKYGFKYPILFATGRLALSLLDRNADGAVNIVEADSFEIGTSIDYAAFHHYGTSRMPRRPLFEENEDSALFRRWDRIADAYVKKIIEGAL